jgi:triphosphoribosyl-dephospho-CoA synthase
MTPAGRPDDAEMSARVAEAFIAACRAELTALKPGNVHVFAPGHRMEVRDFEISAEVAAPFMARRGARVGERVLGAVRATRDAVGQNTNLGILLLCAPIAAAEERPGGATANIGTVLDDLDAKDAADVFAAIALASPGGLGEVAAEDVRQPPTSGLIPAMALAADRDSIARQYVTGFADIVEFAASLPADVREATRPDVVTRLYLSLLARFSDSHIVRKYGREAAEMLSQAAASMLPRLGRPDAHEALMALDAEWKIRSLNPGTSADLTVATIFLRLLQTNK